MAKPILDDELWNSNEFLAEPGLVPCRAGAFNGLSHVTVEDNGSGAV
jgi:hypothetical protein